MTSRRKTARHSLICFVFLSLVLAPAALASAQTSDPREDEQSQEKAKTDKPAKRPPPPLFTKHRRGLYRDRDGLEVIDATPQSPPLETDDPAVPDEGEYEINLTTQADLSKVAQRLNLLFVDANYGIAPKIAGHELPTQVKFEFPVAATRENGRPFAAGVGAAKVGLKFNFYNNEHSGTSIAVYPQLEFAAAGIDSVRKGLAEPGQTFILPILVSKETKYLTLVANSGVNMPIHDPHRETTGTFAVGFGRAIRRTYAAMVDIRTESTFDLRRDRLVTLNGGVMHSMKNVIVYAQLGRSLFSDNGAHSYVGLGVKLLIPRSVQRRSPPE
jgi:hypothetical protein